MKRLSRGTVKFCKAALKFLIITTIGSACIVTTPFLISMITNQFFARKLLWKLDTVQLPSSARFVQKSSRVYNSGNSDGCDYEAKLIVVFDGQLSELINSFSEVLKTQYSSNKISHASAAGSDHWFAKLDNITTLLIDRDLNSPRQFVITLGEYPRHDSFDLRCW